MGITSFNAFCSESKNTSPDERITELKKIFPVIFTILGAIGVGGNVLNLFTLRSSSLQTVPFRYIKALALFDLIGLTAILLHCIFHFTGAWRFLPIAYYSVYVEDFIINSFLVAGLYCAVLLTVERYLLLRKPHSKRIYINSVFAKILGVLIFSVLLHCPMVLQVTYKMNPDGTWKKGNNKEILCKEPYWTIYSYYGFFREFLRFACVFVLVALNIFIARQLQIAKKNRRLLKKHSSTLENSDLAGLKGEKNSLMKSFTEKRLTALMIAICFIYVIGNVPQTIVMMFQNESTETKFSFQVFRYIANTFETLNHCLNFFIFCMASSEYTRAFLNACPCVRNQLELIPCCSRFLRSRRFTVSELQSESRVAILRKPSMTMRDSIVDKSRNRRNTTMVTLKTDSTVTTTQSKFLIPRSPSIRRKSTPTVGFCSIATVSGSVKTSETEDCLVIRNEALDEISSIIINDFQEGDEFL